MDNQTGSNAEPEARATASHVKVISAAANDELTAMTSFFKGVMNFMKLGGSCGVSSASRSGPGVGHLRTASSCGQELERNMGAQENRHQGMGQRFGSR